MARLRRFRHRVNSSVRPARQSALDRSAWRRRLVVLLNDDLAAASVGIGHRHGADEGACGDGLDGLAKAFGASLGNPDRKKFLRRLPAVGERHEPRRRAFAVRACLARVVVPSREAAR